MHADIMSHEQQVEFMTELADAENEFFKTIKSMTLFAYFTSEVGMTQALDYDPLPGKYDPCVKVDDDTRAEAQYF